MKRQPGLTLLPCRRARSWTRALALLGAVLLGGCAQTFELYQVGQVDPGDRSRFIPATAAQAQAGVRVLRGGQPLVAHAGLPLAEGDVIECGADNAAIVRFPDGHEATLLPRTRIRLGSLFADFGEVFVRVYRQVQGRFKVKTQYVTAGVEGTEFWVRVDGQGRQSFGVLDGRIRLASASERWAPVDLLPGEVATSVGHAPPAKDLRQRAEVDAIVERMRRGLINPVMRPPLPPRPP